MSRAKGKSRRRTRRDEPRTQNGPRRAGRVEAKGKPGPVGVIVFGLALGARLAYLYDSSDSPVFDTPIVDAETYDGLARALVENGSLTDAFFWQPCFYPLFLSLVYLVSGSSMLSAKLVSALLGAVTCLLVSRLGTTLFGHRIGLLSGVIAAVYGPLIFFDAELLGTGWSCFWAVALILLFLRTVRAPSMIGCLFSGFCGGLSVLSRPTFLPYVVAVSVWFVYALLRRRTGTGRVAIGSVSLVTGFLAATLPVAALSAATTERFSFLPSSGGLNLYIGNNPDTERTIAIRPGWEWDQLTRLPLHYGVTRKRDTSGFFRDKALSYVRSEPLGFINGLVGKTLHFASARELPRNVDIYLHREWSWLLSGTVWKAGLFGFPFGVFLPLAAFGLLSRWREVPVPIKLFLALYPMSVILVFVTARYRMPVIPVMAPLAAAGCVALIELIRDPRWSKAAAGGTCAAIIAVLLSLPGPYAQERTDYEAEMYYVLGTNARDDGRLRESRLLLATAVELRPDYGDAHNSLGATLQEEGELDLAMVQYRRAVQLNPGHGTAHANLARGYARMDRLDEAVMHFRAAIGADPFDDGLHTSFAIALSRQKKLEEAERHFAQALALAPNDADKHNNMGSVLYQQGKADEAVESYRAALRIEPTHQAALNNLVTALSDEGRTEDARAALRAALEHARASGDAELIQRIERQVRELE